MLNKKKLLKTMLLLGSVAGLSASIAPAVWFNIDLNSESIQAIDMDAITKNMMPIHFVDNWNDFWWFLYSPGGDDIEDTDGVLHIWNYYGEAVSFDGVDNKYACKHRVRWFYYNSERGERLFPIDEETAARWHNVDGVDLQPWLITNGWLYTECMSEGLQDAINSCKNWSEEDEVYDEDQCEMDAKNAHGFNWYYGMVTHVYSWKNFGLIFGAQYSLDDSTNWLSVNNLGLADTFIRYDNKYPVGLLYDYHGWVGFVWCEFTNNKTAGLRDFVDSLNNGANLNDIFEETDGRVIQYIGDSDIALNCSGVGIAANSLIEIVIEWLVWMGKESDWSVIWNQTNPKMQFFKSVNVNNATLVNYAKKKSETLCRWKWMNYEKWYQDGISWLGSYSKHMNYLYSDASISTYSAKPDTWQKWFQFKRGISIWGAWEKTKDRYLAQYNRWNTTFKNEWRLYCVDLTEDTNKTIVAEPWYTYIVKWWNVAVLPMMDMSDNNYYYDVYISSGNLLLDNVGKNDKRVITKEGFVNYVCTNTDCEDYTRIIDDYADSVESVVSGWNSYRGNDVAVWAIIKWNFIVDWQLKHVWEFENELSNGGNHIGNRYFVYWKLTTRDSVSDLEDLFSWRCANWISTDSDEQYCPQSSRSGDWLNPYENAPLIIIDQNYDSLVLNW